MEKKKDNKYIEKAIAMNRVTKVVKGGRRFSFSVIMVVGDGNGKVGYGLGKANEIIEAVRKSLEQARKNMVEIPVKKGTLPHEVIGKFKKGSVLLKPATPGTGVIAGGAVRSIMEAAGVHDVLSKSLGSNNPNNVVRAVFDAIDHMYNAKKIAENRGKTLNELWR